MRVDIKAPTSKNDGWWVTAAGQLHLVRDTSLAEQIEVGRDYDFILGGMAGKYPLITGVKLITPPPPGEKEGKPTPVLAVEKGGPSPLKGEEGIPWHRWVSFGDVVKEARLMVADTMKLGEEVTPDEALGKYAGRFAWAVELICERIRQEMKKA